MKYSKKLNLKNKSFYGKNIVILLLLLLVGLPFTNNRENTSIVASIIQLLEGTNDSIINGGFENDVISSNYEYIDISEWNSVTHDNKTLVSKYGQIPTYYFVEINSSKPNSYYRDITLEQNKDYTFDISHRAHIRSNTTGEFTFDELAIIFGPKQTITPSQNSNNKDQFMQITSWLKENIEEIAGNNISNKYVVYSSKFTENGTFETEGFSFTKTEEYTEKWLIWIAKSSTYNFFDYTVNFNSEDLEDCIVALSSVSSGYIGNDKISYGNIVKEFKIYNNDNVLIDFDLQKIYEENQTTFSSVITKGYGTFAALNGTTPPITDNWWNVTEPTKVIEFGYFSSTKNAYSLQEISRISGFEGKQFVVADNIYQNVNIGDNTSLEISFITKSLNLLPKSPNRIYLFNATNVPSMNSETKKTQLDLISEYLNNNYLAETNEISIIYTAGFDSNGLFTVPIEDAFSDTLDDIHTTEIYYVEYPGNTSDVWKKRSHFIDLTDTGIKNEISIYFNSNAYAGESNLLDNVQISYTTEREFLNTEFEGNGTEVEPYLIKNEEDFIKFRTYAYNSKSEFSDMYFKQTANITFTSDLTSLEIPSFAGTYDGAGYILDNINISSSASRAKVSIFFELTGTIRNLGIKNATITGWSTSGIADSITENGVVENCFVQATLISTNSTESYAAGIASSINKNAKIINTYYYGSQNAKTPFGIGAYRANSTPTFINAFSNMDPNISTYNATGSNPTITNSSTKTLTEMQSDEFLSILNEYTKTNNNLVSWDFDTENGLPTLVPDVVSPELKKLYVKNTDDGNDLIWISSNNQYYLYLSKNIDRKNMITNYITNSNQIEVYAYDKYDNLLGKIENDIPNNYFEKDKVIIKLKYKDNLSTEYEVNIMQSNLPSVYLNISPTETETADQLLNQINGDPNHDIGFPGVAYIRNSNDELTTASFKKMKGRGNATWTYSKRPYQVKFNEAISMLGMKESKTWLFITNYTDGSLTRSATFYKLAQDLGIDYAIEFETADVYINGKYNGTYLVTSKVEKDVNRVDITKNDSLIEIDNYVDTYQFTSNITNHKFTIKYPDLEGETTEIQNEKIQYNKTLIDNLESKIYDQNVSYEELSQIIDMESFAKAYWVFEISENYDAMYGSTYIYTKDNLIHMGPMWDFDNTLNMLSKNNTSLTDYYLLGTTGGAQANRVRWFNELIKRQEFSDLIDKIFLENIDIFKNLANDASEYNQKIQKSALMNYSRYPYSAMKAEKPYYMGGNSFEEASNNLISSIAARVNFYLNEYKNLNIEKIKYTTVDVDNNTITDTVEITNNLLIKLPNTLAEDAEISLVGITQDNLEREITTIKLNNGTYQNEVSISNDVSVNCDKKTNRSLYMLSLEREEKAIKELKIITKPNKTEYYEEDLFDKTGMVVHAIYTDNTFEEITDYNINKTILSINDTTVEINYENKSVNLPITVKENTLESITVKQLPNKTNYIEGENIDLEGLVVEATYANGKKENITDYTLLTNEITLNTKKISIGYLELTCNFNISVEENTITSIEIANNPLKLTYIEGEVFNSEGLEVLAIYKRGNKVEITDYTYSTNKLTTADTTITVKYLGFSVNIDITVNESPIKSIEIKTKPTKLTYVEGEVFDPSGMKVIAVKENGMEKEITDYTYNTNKLSTTDTTITVKYLEFTTAIDITVNESPIKSIKVKTKPTKLTYIEGEVFDPSGMKVIAVKENGMEKEITDYTYNTNKLTTSDTSIAINYQNFTSSIDIVVEENIVVKLEMTTKPTKLTYIEGETFNPEGLTLIATYKNNTTKEITDYTYNKNKLSTTDTTITVKYLGFSVNIDIIVNESPIKSIEIKTKPTKLTYVEGEVFDPSGMKVIAVKENGMEKEITDYTYNTNKLSTTDTTITVKYLGFSVNIDIIVNESPIKSIEIKTKPTKLTYVEGEVFDPSGMKVIAVKENGMEKEITDYTYNTNKLSTTDTTITVKYLGFSVNIDIIVNESPIKSIEIKTKPTKLTYVEGEVFDPSGMKVIAVKENGMEKEITDYTYNTNKLTTSDTSIAIKYQNFTSNIDIVVEENIVVKLEMTKKPTKLTYIEGETFNPEGLTLIATYKNNTTKEITDYTYNKNKLTTTDKTITVKYSGFSVNIDITVNESPIKNIKVKTKPTKLIYVEGEVFDPSGMQVIAVKENGMEKEITDYTYNENKLTTANTTITVKYLGFSVNIDITVNESPIKSIAIKTKPTKLTYVECEVFDPSGMKVIAVKENGMEKEITDYTYNENKLTTANTTITVKYLGFSVNIDITVNESPIKSIEIKTKPTKLTYVEGEVFDPSGMKVIAVKENGMEKEITDYTYNENKLTTGDTKIEISYEGYKVSLSITVEKTKDSNGNNSENSKPENSKPEVIKPETNTLDNTQDAKEEYTFVSGENQTIYKTNRNNLRLEINANSKLLSRILINGKQLSEKDYTIDEDKLIIEINNEYLSALNDPENTVEVALTNGQVIKTKFFINEEDKEKPIIDDTDEKEEEEQITKAKFNKNWLYTLLIIPLVYFIVVFVKRKKEIQF